MLLAIILYSCDCSCILSAYIVSEMKNRDALRITWGYKEAYARPFVVPLVHCPRFFHIWNFHLILTDCQQLKYISFRSRVSMNVCVASVKKAQVLLLYILAYTEHFGNFTVCHTNMLIYWCHSMYSSFLFYTFIYKGSSLLVGSHSTLRPFSPGFPGNLVRVEEKSKSCEGKASFSLSPLIPPSPSFSLVSECGVCVQKPLSPCCHFTLSSSLHRIRQAQGLKTGEGIQPMEVPARHFLWPSLPLCLCHLSCPLSPLLPMCCTFPSCPPRPSTH